MQHDGKDADISMQLPQKKLTLGGILGAPTPAFGPEDLRQLATEAVAMQEALVQIKIIAARKDIQPEVALNKIRRVLGLD